MLEQARQLQFFLGVTVALATAAVGLLLHLVAMSMQANARNLDLMRQTIETTLRLGIIISITLQNLPMSVPIQLATAARQLLIGAAIGFTLFVVFAATFCGIDCYMRESD